MYDVDRFILFNERFTLTNRRAKTHLFLNHIHVQIIHVDLHVHVFLNQI